MTESIAREFRFGELLRFSFPSIIMMIFMSLYTIVDGFFVSRFVGTDALSAINIVYPLISVFVAVAVMFATGGSAVVSRQMGEGDAKGAKQNFSLIILVSLILTAIIMVISFCFLDPIILFLGADDSLLSYCREYLIILLLFAPFSVLQMLFQSFFVTAGKPGLGLSLTIFAGAANMVLDYLFIVPFKMGIAGAAFATAIGYCIPAVGGLIFFFRNKNGLYFIRPRWRWGVIWESSFNGSSEMVTNLSASVTTLLFNIMMMKFAGADGVAAITVVLYCQFLMVSLFMGFSIGVAPIISYHYGSGNKPYLKKLLKMCGGFTLAGSVVIFIVSFCCSTVIAAVFSPADSAVFPMVVHGMRLFSISFLFAGINIFGSALFTALSNGKISAAISFSRTFLFTVAGILLLSRLFGMDGLWLSIPFAEAVTVFFVLLFIRKLKTQYGIF